jgi:putative membrane protein
MIHWPASSAIDAAYVGKRLGLVLLAVAAYCAAVGLLVRVFELRLLDWGGSTASLTNSVILSLLMVFRNRVAYDHWWEARGLWGKLTNESRNLAAKCAAFLPAAVLARSRVAELLAGFAVALKRHLRDESPRLQDLPGFEKETAEPHHVPLALAQRLFTVIAGWKRDGLIDQAELWVLDTHARGLLDVCGACEKIKSTTVSPSYKGLLRTGLVLNVVAEPWLTMPEIGFWSLPPFLLMCFFLFGLELIDTVVEEPFGRERDDLDLDRYCQTIRASVEAVLPSGG